MAETNRIQMIVFDWAGTTVDYGSSAPSEVFDRVFSQAGIHLTREGYQMQGEMLVEALLAAYSDYLRRCAEVAPEKADLSEMKRTDKE